MRASPHDINNAMPGKTSPYALGIIRFGTSKLAAPVRGLLPAGPSFCQVPLTHRDEKSTRPTKQPCSRTGPLPKRVHTLGPRQQDRIIQFDPTFGARDQSHPTSDS